VDITQEDPHHELNQAAVSLRLLILKIHVLQQLAKRLNLFASCCTLSISAGQPRANGRSEYT
jgi:hypothetical protein